MTTRFPESEGGAEFTGIVSSRQEWRVAMHHGTTRRRTARVFDLAGQLVLNVRLSLSEGCPRCL
jgi:hypothetical protein